MTGILKFNNVEVFGSDGKVTTAGMPAGSVLSFQETTYNTQVNITSESFTTLSDILSITITPKSTSSKFYLSANIPYKSSPHDKYLTGTFFKDDSDFLGLSYGLGMVGSGGTTNVVTHDNLVISYLDESSIPSTPVPIKYSVAFKVSASGTSQQLFDSGITGTFILMEIQG